MVPPIGTLIHDNFFFLRTFTPRSCERRLLLLLREGTRGVARPERNPGTVRAGIARPLL